MTIHSGNGPHCDALMDGFVDVMPGDTNDRASIAVYDGRNRLIYQTDIEKMR